MRVLAQVMAVLLLVTLLSETPARAETRVQVEIVHLTYTSQTQPRQEMHKQLAEWAKTVEGSPQPLVSLLDEWLEGQDRAAFTAEAMHVTAALGQEVEVLSQQPLTITKWLPYRTMEGLGVKLQTGEAKDGQIALEIDFRKSSPEWNTIQPTVDERGRPVPGYQVFGFNTNLTLQLGTPHVLEGLFQGLLEHTRTPEGNATKEKIVIIRVR